MFICLPRQFNIISPAGGDGRRGEGCQIRQPPGTATTEYFIHPALTGPNPSLPPRGENEIKTYLQLAEVKVTEPS